MGWLINNPPASSGFPIAARSDVLVTLGASGDALNYLLGTSAPIAAPVTQGQQDAAAAIAEHEQAGSDAESNYATAAGEQQALTSADSLRPDAVISGAIADGAGRSGQQAQGEPASPQQIADAQAFILAELAGIPGADQQWLAALAGYPAIELAFLPWQQIKQTITDIVNAPSGPPPVPSPPEVGGGPDTVPVADFRALSDRVTALEQRPPVQGPPGDVGPQGEPGPRQPPQQIVIVL